MRPRIAAAALAIGPCTAGVAQADEVPPEFQNRPTPANCYNAVPTIVGAGFIVGGPGPDVIVGSNGPDIILGPGAGDTIFGGDGMIGPLWIPCAHRPCRPGSRWPGRRSRRRAGPRP
jgi:hypothetical protein